MVVDWTGTNPQVKGAINNTLSFTKAASYTGVRSVLPPGIPNNEGVFRAIEVICPPGTVGNGVLPAACAARGLTGFRMVDCMFGALAMMLPDKVKAAGDGGNTGISIGGYDADAQAVRLCRLHLRRLGRAALGRRARRQLAHVRQHGLALDRGDRGRAADPAHWPTSSSPTRPAPASSAAACRSGATTGSSSTKACCRCAPTGATIGRSASMAAARARRRRTTSTPTRENRLLPSKLTMTIKQGDVFRHVLAGAGGWGDPLERDPAAVLRDVRNELLSPREGRWPTTASSSITAAWTVDAAATAAPPRGNPQGARLDGPSRRSSGTIPMLLAPRRGIAHMAVTYRVGVDIGGTFTDIVLLGSDGTIHTKKISSSVGNYAQAIVDGLERGFQRDRARRRRPSRRSATAPPSPPTPSSSTRARASA